MIYLININLLGFLICSIDKWRAIHHKWRIPEISLLLISVIGGCFGMLFSMYLFHHKTRKWKFKFVPVCCMIWSILILKMIH